MRPSIWPPADDDPFEGVQRFFEGVPAAVVAYSAAIGSAALAASIVRLAVHLFFNV